MRLKRRIKYAVEAIALIGLYGICRILPLDKASALGAWIGVRIGERLSRANRIAQRNLLQAFPEKTEEARETIRKNMWAHLGRNAAEFAHFRGTRLFSRVTCKGLEHLPPKGTPVLFVSGHLGHWELTYPIAYEYGLPITLIYRHLNNPYLDRFLAWIRSAHASDMFPKGPRGAAKLGGALKRRENLALLIDQKMNEGMSIPFFGRNAMTATAVAQFALRFHMPIIPAKAVRTQGCHFMAAVYPPLMIPNTGNPDENIRAILTALNTLLEQWIRETPEQWLWIHRRFEKSFYHEDTIAATSPS